LNGELDGVACRDFGGVWDHAPYVCLVEEAGGMFSDSHGGKRLDLRAGVYASKSVGDDLAAVLFGR
jgi:histidinol-phosphatase